MNATRAGIGHRPVVFLGEGKFLVLGADAELRLRLAARFEPGDEFVARLDRGHVNLITSHASVRLFFAQKGRDVKHGALQRAMREDDVRACVIARDGGAPGASAFSFSVSHKGGWSAALLSRPDAS